MKIMKIVKIAGLIAVVAVVLIIAVMGFIFLDAMSYTATGSETLSPAGNVTGNALVVYDPGISGYTKDMAVKIAGDLQTKGYAVDLAGVRSSAAGNTSGYDVIVAGGPIYAGNVSGSIGAYLKALKPQDNAKIGVFATGQDKDILNDPIGLRKEVTSLPDDSTLKIKAITKFVKGDDVDKRRAEFIAELLQ
jgi:menaquinone-dependent protoporphyrinogen IX oxidase